LVLKRKYSEPVREISRPTHRRAPPNQAGDPPDTESWPHALAGPTEGAAEAVTVTIMRTMFDDRA
jgi:hypothetical protein